LAGLDHFLDEILFFLLKLVHLVFHSALGNQPDHLHYVLLPDPVRPVGCLLFYGRVPP
jgi:hypothetical protein